MEYSFQEINLQDTSAPSKEIAEHIFTVKNILVIGQSGFGKSSTINTLLGEKQCEVSHSVSETVEVNYFTSKLIDGSKANIYDTPGFGDTKLNISNEHIARKIQFKMLQQIQNTKQLDSLVVVQAIGGGRSYIEINLQNMENVFGKNFHESVIVILTKCESHLNMLICKIESYIKKAERSKEVTKEFLKKYRSDGQILDKIQSSPFCQELREALNVMHKYKIKAHIPLWSNRFEDFEEVIDKLDSLSFILEIVYLDILKFNGEFVEVYLKQIQEIYSNFIEPEVHYNFLRLQFNTCLQKTGVLRLEELLSLNRNIQAEAQGIFFRHSKDLEKEYERMVEKRTASVAIYENEIDELIEKESKSKIQGENATQAIKVGGIGAAAATLACLISLPVALSVGVATAAGTYLVTSSNKEKEHKKIKDQIKQDIEQTFKTQTGLVTFSQEIEEILNITDSGDGFHKVEKDSINKNYIKFEFGARKRKDNNYQIEIEVLFKGFKNKQARHNKESVDKIYKEIIRIISEILNQEILPAEGDLKLIVEQAYKKAQKWYTKYLNMQQEQENEEITNQQPQTLLNSEENFLNKGNGDIEEEKKQ